MNHFLRGFGDELEKIAISKKKLLAILGLGAGGYLYSKGEKPMSELEKMMRSNKKRQPLPRSKPGGGKSGSTGLFHPGHIRGRFTFPKQRGNK